MCFLRVCMHVCGCVRVCDSLAARAKCEQKVCVCVWLYECASVCDDGDVGGARAAHDYSRENAESLSVRRAHHSACVAVAALAYNVCKRIHSYTYYNIRSTFLHTHTRTRSHTFMSAKCLSACVTDNIHPAVLTYLHTQLACEMRSRVQSQINCATTTRRRRRRRMVPLQRTHTLKHPFKPRQI